MALYIIIVEESEIVRERRLQTRITFRDIERVAVVGDIKQVGHTRLRGRSAIVDSQIADTREPVAELNRRAPVGHRAGCINVYALIVLHVFRFLRLNHDTGIQLELRLNPSVHQLRLVYIVPILRIAAQVIIQIIADWTCHTRQIGIPVAIFRCDAIKECTPHFAEVIR